jgi:two-component system, NtrC family, nitrogen regulation response regulator NtrX
VRQLRNIVERILILAPGDPGSEITADRLPVEAWPNGASTARGDLTQAIGKPLREAREQFEREYLTVQITRFGGNISRTAQFVGMERSALHRKLKSLSIDTPRGGESEEDAASTVD